MFIQSIPVPSSLEPRLSELSSVSSQRYHGYDRLYRIAGTPHEYAVGVEHDDELRQYWPAEMKPD